MGSGVEAAGLASVRLWGYDGSPWRQCICGTGLRSIGDPSLLG